MVQDVKPGGVFLASCAWSADELGEILPAAPRNISPKTTSLLYV
jgi:hypothetical protein